MVAVASADVAIEDRKNYPDAAIWWPALVVDEVICDVLLKLSRAAIAQGKRCALFYLKAGGSTMRVTVELMGHD